MNMISHFMQGGCICENAPNLRIDTDNMEIGALAAPHPLLMVSATGDWTRDTERIEGITGGLIAPYLTAAGITPAEDPESSRKLIIGTNQPDVRLIIVRASDRLIERIMILTAGMAWGFMLRSSSPIPSSSGV